jgi:hypothetical protein
MLASGNVAREKVLDSVVTQAKGFTTVSFGEVRCKAPVWCVHSRARARIPVQFVVVPQYNWADGSTYKGQFKEGMWHGSALYVTKSGTRFRPYRAGPASVAWQGLPQVVRDLRSW